MKEHIENIAYAIAIILIITCMILTIGVSIKKDNYERFDKPCSEFKESFVKDIPVRCLKEFK